MKEFCLLARIGARDFRRFGFGGAATALPLLTESVGQIRSITDFPID